MVGTWLRVYSWWQEAATSRDIHVFRRKWEEIAVEGKRGKHVHLGHSHSHRMHPISGQNYEYFYVIPCIWCLVFQSKSGWFCVLGHRCNDTTEGLCPFWAECFHECKSFNSSLWHSSEPLLWPQWPWNEYLASSRIPIGTGIISWSVKKGEVNKNILRLVSHFA